MSGCICDADERWLCTGGRVGGKQVTFCQCSCHRRSQSSATNNTKRGEDNLSGTQQEAKGTEAKVSNRTGAVEATAEWRAIIDSLRVCAVNAGDEHFEKHGMRFTIRPTEAKALLEAVSQPEQREPDSRTFSEEQIEAAWKLCRIYFDIAARFIGEDDVRRCRDAIIAGETNAAEPWRVQRLRCTQSSASAVGWAAGTSLSGAQELTTSNDTPPVSQQAPGSSEEQARELRWNARTFTIVLDVLCKGDSLTPESSPAAKRNRRAQWAMEATEKIRALRTGVSAQPRIKTRLSKREDGKWEAQWVRVFDNPEDALAALEGVSAQPERPTFAETLEQMRALFTPEELEQLGSAQPERSEPLDEQIGRLADFIINEIPGEPSRSEGAVDTAIRLLRASQPERVQQESGDGAR